MASRSHRDPSPRRPRLSRGRPFVTKGRLTFELLEARLALSATPLAVELDYEQVSAKWFGTAAPLTSSAVSASATTSSATASIPTATTTEWIVRLTPAAVQQAGSVVDAASLLVDLPIAVVRGLGLPGQLLVTSAASASTVAAALGSSSLVAAFEQDSLVGGATDPPNDPLFNGLQDALFNFGQNGGTPNADVDANRAWDITTGSASVVVAVIDSGVYRTHPDLAANMWSNPGEAGGTPNFDDDGNGFIDDIHGWDFANDDNDPVDDHGHGTHVAGIIGAAGNNGTGVAGVNWTTSLMALKFLDENNVGSVSDAAMAINYAKMMRTRASNPVNVRVINASWGGSGVDDLALRQSIASAGAADILFVSAAGNGDVFGRGQNIDQFPFFPASFGLDNMLTVAATDRNDQLANFSNYGVGAVDIAAPGLGILSTELFIDAGVVLPSYGTRTGTSMAVPHVVGTAALIWSKSPGATAVEVRDAILAGGDSLPNLQGIVASGKRLDAHGALQSLAPQARVTSALDVTAIGGNTYQFSVELTSNVGIIESSIGNGDFTVRRQLAGASPIAATLVGTPISSEGGRVWTAAYQITPPGGAWDVVDAGGFAIELVGGQLLDLNGIPSRSKTVDTFLVDLSNLGVFRPTVFTDGGPNSLRAAIQQANALDLQAVPNGGFIILAPGTYTLSIAGRGEDAVAAGDLDITGKVTIASDGTGPVVINAAGIDRVFDVLTNAVFTLDGVTITGGIASSDDGGGIRNAGTLDIFNTSIVNNSAGTGGGAPGSLDTSFGGDGKVTTDFVGLASSDIVYSTVVQSDGKIVVAGFSDADNTGNHDFALARYNADGTLDTSFAGDGTVTTDFSSSVDVIQSMAIQSDGKIIVAGYSDDGSGGNYDFALARYNTNGTLDPSFDGDGKRTLSLGGMTEILNSLVVQSDGKILVAGHTGNVFALVRFNTDGSLDTSLDGDGTVTMDLGGFPLPSMAVQIDGKIVVAGVSANGATLDFALARFNSDGSLDASFDEDGKLFTDFDSSNDAILGVVLQSDGKIVVAGQSQNAIYSDFALARYNTDGSLDTSFDGDGKLTTDFGATDGAYSVALQSDGKIVVSGRSDYPNFSKLALARYSTDGSLDLSFDGDGKVDADFGPSSVQESYSMALQRDGKIVVSAMAFNGSNFDFAVARFQGVETDGGGIHNAGTLTISSSTISENDSVFDGGGVYNAGSLVMTASTLSANTAERDGGGVYNIGTLTTANVTISSNSAAKQGGGLFNAVGAMATATNSTISGNSAAETGAVPIAFNVIGSEFFIASGNTSEASVGVNRGGRALVAWNTNASGNFLVHGRFVNSLGSDGPAFTINPVAPSYYPSVTMDASGNTIVAWSNGASPNEARRYTAQSDVGGNTASSTFPLQTTPLANASAPRLASSASGAAIAVWETSTSGQSSVQARRLTTTGEPFGAEIPVSVTSIIPQNPHVAMDDQGRFVVTMLFNSNPNVVEYKLYARIFDPQGNPLTAQFLVGEVSGDGASSTLIDENGIIVAWKDETNSAVAKAFDLSGNSLSARIPLSANGVLVDFAPQLVRLDGGGFYAVWQETHMFEADVYGRQFSASGTPVGSQSIINSTITGQQFLAGFARLSPTELIAVWIVNNATKPIYGSIISGPLPDFGGGIFNEGALTANSSTIANNLTSGNGGGIVNRPSATTTLKNTIVAGNHADGPDVDVMGSFSSNGGNLVGDVGSAAGLVNGSNGNKVGTSAAPLDPKLAPLADNGGPTRTHLPAADSPAIDAAIAGGPALDQRGVARTADGDNSGVGEPDIGAVERYNASISGRKFRDENDNGVQDAGEPGLIGWTIYLDANQNGQLDPGERSTITDALGNYSFIELVPGPHTVAEVNQTGWTRTYASTNYASNVRQGEDGVTGLTNVHELTFSPDGVHAYAVNSDPAVIDSIVTFSRNAATGALQFITAQDHAGLEGEGHIVVSPDGKHVYALGTAGNTVVVYSRNAATGLLTFVESRATAAGPNDLVISPNGAHLYILGSAGSALQSFTRNATTGVLSPLAPRAQTGPALAISPDGKHVYTTNGANLAAYLRNTGNGSLGAAPLFTFSDGQPASGGGTADALTDVTDLAVSPDGAFLYTLSRGDQSIGVYQRNSTSGTLAFVEKITRGVVDSEGAVVDGLDGAKSLTISPSGDRVYATGDAANDEDDSIAVFARSETTGRLAYQHVLKQFGEDSLLNFVVTMGNPDGVAVSPDGGSIYVAAREATEGAITQFRRDGVGLDRVTLLIGEDRTAKNFSAAAAPGKIRGAVYDDLDSDGARDQEEYGLGGVTVFLDLNGNALPDDGVGTTTTTDVLGAYEFASLTAPSDYIVRVALQNGQTLTAPSSLPGLGRVWGVALDPAETFTGANFLIHTSLAGQGVGNNQISGFVWQDANGDGVKQPAENFIAGRQIYIDVNDNGVFDAPLAGGPDIPANALTAANGAYAFTNLGATNFAVRVVTLPGELTSTPVGNSFAKQTLTTGANPLGLVAADFNGDGKPDFASVDGGVDRVSIRLQLANGSFGTRAEYEVGSAPTGIAVGRFNSDAYPDIAIVHWSLSKVVFLINNGNGTFTRGAAATEISVPIGYTTIAAANIDGDGDDDLAIAVDGEADSVRILRNNNGSTPSFTQIQQLDFGTGAPLSISAGDLTGDGRPDFVVGNFVGDSVTVLKNIAGTSFTPLTVGLGAAGPASVAIVPDMNGDGHKDVVVASIAANAVTILNGNGMGGLGSPTIIPVGQGPRSVTVADVDGDTDLDLIVGNSLSNDVVVLRRQGPGLVFGFPESSGLASFSALVASGVKQVLVADLDANGVLDLAAVRGDAGTGSLAVLHNALAPGSFRLTFTGVNQNATLQNFGITTAAAEGPGDYDDDNDVDGSDFLRWQRTLGSAVAPNGSGADGSGNGLIDAADLTVWRSNFGQTYAVAAASGNSWGIVATLDVVDDSSSGSAGTNRVDWFLNDRLFESLAAAPVRNHAIRSRVAFDPLPLVAKPQAAGGDAGWFGESMADGWERPSDDLAAEYDDVELAFAALGETDGDAAWRLSGAF